MLVSQAQDMSLIATISLQQSGLRLVFTGDGVVVIIRSVERYDRLKIKPTSEGSRTPILLISLPFLVRTFSYLPIPFTTPRENWIVGVGSRSRKISQSQRSIPGLLICWFFCFCFRLRQSSFHWIISNGVVNGIGRNENVLILPTPIPSSL